MDALSSSTDAIYRAGSDAQFTSEHLGSPRPRSNDGDHLVRDFDVAVSIAVGRTPVAGTILAVFSGRFPREIGQSKIALVVIVMGDLTSLGTRAPKECDSKRPVNIECPFDTIVAHKIDHGISVRRYGMVQDAANTPSLAIRGDAFNDPIGTYFV